MSEIPKAYEPQSVEARWYDEWVRNGYFTADPARVYAGGGALIASGGDVNVDTNGHDVSSVNGLIQGKRVKVDAGKGKVLVADSKGMGSGIEAVKLAVALGADVNAANKAGETALFAAAYHGFNTVIQFLVDKGARLDVRNARGQTLLMTATGPRASGRQSLPLGSMNDRSTEELLRKLGLTE